MPYVLKIDEDKKFRRRSGWTNLKISVLKENEAFVNMIADIEYSQISSNVIRNHTDNQSYRSEDEYKHDNNYELEEANCNKLLNGTPEVKELQYVFKDTDGHASIVFTDHCMQFDLSFVDKGSIGIMVEIQLNDKEYTQFKTELRRWIIY